MLHVSSFLWALCVLRRGAPRAVCTNARESMLIDSAAKHMVEVQVSECESFEGPRSRC